MTMREKIARAIAAGLDKADQGGVACDEPLDRALIDGHFNLLIAADAVLDALMEPDEGMIEAGWFAISCRHPDQCYMSRGVELEAWTAMLTAARSGG